MSVVCVCFALWFCSFGAGCKTKRNARLFPRQVMGSLGSFRGGVGWVSPVRLPPGGWIGPWFSHLPLTRSKASVPNSDQTANLTGPKIGCPIGKWVEDTQTCGNGSLDFNFLVDSGRIFRYWTHKKRRTFCRGPVTATK